MDLQSFNARESQNRNWYSSPKAFIFLLLSNHLRSSNLFMQSNPFFLFQTAFQARVAQLACLAINHLLKLEPSVQQHLKAHVNCRVLLRWEPLLIAPAGEQSFCISSDLQLNAVPSDDTLIPDVTVTLLAGLVTAEKDARLRFIRIEGDALLAQDLSRVASELRWDAEHDLARVVGDTPAHWLVNNAKQAAQAFAEAAEAFLAKISGKSNQQLASGSDSALLAHVSQAPLINRDEFARHAAQLQALQAQIDALSNRYAASGVKIEARKNEESKTKGAA